MKILIISTYDLYGGAAIAANRLLQALNKHGVQAKMIVREKQSNDENIIEVGTKIGNKLRFVWERVVIFLRNGFSRKHLFDVSIANTGVSVMNLPEFKEADVIHLHWINQGMLSLNEIGRILRSGKKIVWTMHDMWPFSGAWHHVPNRENYPYSLDKCRDTSFAHSENISRSVYLKKQKQYRKHLIHFVACSCWLKKLAVKSELTNEHNVEAIPNPIDTTQFFPKEKSQIREKFGLPKNKKIILFAAAKLSDIRKGTAYMLEATSMLVQKRNDIVCMAAGKNAAQIKDMLLMPTYCLGYVGTNEMVDVYNAADVFVTPSLQENLPNTIMESLACGVPCVGFDVGGIPEMIDHKQNGYVAEYKNAADLAKGILWTLFEADAETLRHNAREKTLRAYNEKAIVQEYLKIYRR